MRPKPTIPVPTIEKKERSHYVTQVREYELITPLFGGGIEPGIVDTEIPISGKAIRGQLRFWWRATRGGEFEGDLERMKKREDEIWGGSGKFDKENKNKIIRGQSPISITIQVTRNGEEDRPFEVVQKFKEGVPQINEDGTPKPKIQPRQGSSGPPYVSFSLQPKEKDAKVNMMTKAIRNGVTFSIAASFPTLLKDEIEAAFWAWETFGGVGARTRRGFGAVHRVSGGQLPSPGTGNFEENLKSDLQKFVSPGKWPDGVPHLARKVSTQGKTCFQLGIKKDTAKDAWSALLENLKEFRQFRNPGSDPSGKRPGRSRWPEPDAIRRLTGQTDPKHQDPITTFDSFPRAAFGLPIIFHFNKDKKSRDPRDTTLEGGRANGVDIAKDIKRLASPLILRPVKFGEKQFAGLMVRLIGQGKIPGGIVLQGTRGYQEVETDLSVAEAAKISVLNGETDVLQAFFNWVSKQKG